MNYARILLSATIPNTTANRL